MRRSALYVPPNNDRFLANCLNSEFVVEGRMIDLPCVAHYERVIARGAEAHRRAAARTPRR